MVVGMRFVTFRSVRRSSWSGASVSHQLVCQLRDEWWRLPRGDRWEPLRWTICSCLDRIVTLALLHNRIQYRRLGTSRGGTFAIKAWRLSIKLWRESVCVTSGRVGSVRSTHCCWGWSPSTSSDCWRPDPIPMLIYAKIETVYALGSLNSDVAFVRSSSIIERSQ